MFTGTYTAIVTPFKAGQIDANALVKGSSRGQTRVFKRVQHPVTALCLSLMLP